MSFTYPVTLTDAARGLDKTLSPGFEQRAAIARDLNLLFLETFEVRIVTQPWFDGVELQGAWTARIVQACSVTLERIDSDLSGDFTVHVVPEGSLHASAAGEEEEFDPDAIDPPDVISGGKVDLGAYALEHLALEIDPFPRLPGAEFTPPDPGPDLSPFAILKKLKGGDPG